MALDPNLPAAAAIAGFMALEYGIGRARGRRLYALADSLSDVGTSLGQLVVQAMLGFTTIGMYAWLEANLGLLEFPADSPLWWVLAWLLLELTFYWRHRAGHEMHLFWTIHEVHHQSPEYNLAVAQRVGYLQWAQTAVFVIPLAVLGIPPAMFAALFAAIHFYQFLIHTRLVERLGVLEHVLMTPSHHRAHHGRNPRYLDRNYGFTLILFDRFFGTFQAEDEEPRYGTLTPLPSWNPIDNNLRPWARLLGAIRHAPDPLTALTVSIRHPAWNPRTGVVELPGREAPVAPRPVPADGGTPWLRVTITVGFGLAVVGSLALVQSTDLWSTPVRLAVGLGVLALTAGVGLLTERGAGETT
jgi:sterol desaturase/sphingolipid hydroxylase (fatty acid hydroxylase superfamily)